MSFKFRYCPQCGSELVTKPVDGRERKVCPTTSCNFVFWNNPVPVVVIIPENENGIILAHNRRWPKGIYSVISGFVESNESPEEASVRELKEELGLNKIEQTFVGNFVFQKMNQLLIAYHVRVTGEVTLNDELDDYIIVSKDRLVGWNKSKKFEVGEWLNNLKVLID
jgi:NAD+ diphosphatase